jgi:hypothetical protein
MIEDISTGVSTVKDLIEYVRGLKTARQREIGEAVSQVLDAAFETRSYIAKIEANKTEESPDKEDELRDLWNKASKAIYFIKPDLGDKCMMKADGWADSRLWESPRYRHVALDLDTIIYDCQRILRNIDS